jgi:uncharacterized protein YciI
MFVIDLNYIVPLEEIDRHMNDHMQFLRECYKHNIFIASGRKVPRTGGIILAMADSKEQIAAIIAEDPFCKLKLAEATITEFNTSQTHPEFKKLVDWKK